MLIFVLTFQDWLDIDFGIAEGVDFIAVSFVKSAEVINHLKSYIKARARDRYIYTSYSYITALISVSFRLDLFSTLLRQSKICEIFGTLI